MTDVALLDSVTESTTQPDALRAGAKRLLCSLIAALPCRCWPMASGIVRRLWAGFYHA